MPRHRCPSAIPRAVARAVALLLAVASPSLAEPPPLSPAEVSSVNQVFQFSFSTTTAWPDGSKTSPTAYLYIPETCRKVRGVIVLCANVPEHRLAGHPLIRKVAAENDLAIVWCAPSFMNFRKDKEKNTNMAEAYDTAVGSLQSLLDGLARSSGYAEIATAPWLPIGESGHLLMVDALVEHSPDRVIAGIWLKNNHFPPKNRTVPGFVVFGSAQEWSQDKSDIRTKWNDTAKAYDALLTARAAAPNWPMSYLLDGASGHFDCSEPLTAFVAEYIGDITKARLAPDGSLKPVDVGAGTLADIPAPGRAPSEPLPAASATDAAASFPWYPTRSLARHARKLSTINWSAKTQFIGFRGDDGKLLPYDFNGITNLKSVAFEPDGRTFTVRPVVVDAIPPGFVGAGEPLATTPGVPDLEWLCGSLELLGRNDAGDGYRVRISLDRTWRIATYLAARQPGTDDIRPVVQPLGVDMLALRNTQGAPQKITFEKIADVPVGTESVPLRATSDSGLPVSFYVVAGPAVVRGDTLVFTPVPPGARLPLTVTVAAWQWGRSAEPKVKTADVVRTSFLLTPPIPPASAK